MQQIVECVANFSEGRRQDIVDQIVKAIGSVNGVIVLDYESDADHNRSVVSFVGEPLSIVQAAYNGIAEAAKLIDLDQHKGEHPRLGATDVVPFIPIKGVTMQNCVELAQQLGQRVGDELNIPVYLYEAAATRPDRENLAKVRKGEYEQLKTEIGQNPDRDPDFGPTELGKAGATIIGARDPLVAYNVYLTTTDVSIAQKIGRAVRHSSGGLRFVKALGMEVDGKAQVSMNLTNFNKTPIYRVVEMIRREAARYGVNIEKSELIGLIPQKALIDSAQWYLQLDDFKPEQVLETRLTEAETEDFLDQLADRTPAPGGGSAAAYSGAMAASLVGMVARLTVGKQKYANVEARMSEIIDEADELKQRLSDAVQQDADAFNDVMAAFKLSKNTNTEKEMRAAAIEKATHQAAAAPLETATMAVDVLKLAVDVASNGNSNAITDAGTAGALASAALTGAAMNVRINTTSVKDQNAARTWLKTLEQLESQASALIKQLNNAVRERGGIQV